MQLTAAHWVYLSRHRRHHRDDGHPQEHRGPGRVATFLTALVFRHSVCQRALRDLQREPGGGTTLFNIFLIIALVTAMLGALQAIGADTEMVTPFRGVMRNGTSPSGRSWSSPT